MWPTSVPLTQGSGGLRGPQSWGGAKEWPRSQGTEDTSKLPTLLGSSLSGSAYASTPNPILFLVNPSMLQEAFGGTLILGTFLGGAEGQIVVQDSWKWSPGTWHHKLVLSCWGQAVWYSFIQPGFSVSCVPGTVLGIEDTAATTNGTGTCNHRVPVLKELACCGDRVCA